ncbi:hypothetical protein J1605_017404 [Eschrichtius robustus]|uniref:Uncharacterized protein n=1 Tax=Eschrichtius robustus TaxID=9764 RepID=A0AB34HZS8_ESCRO|nr:hypothetical protein J1605_017404 [Eschrichtius robustus]
MNMPKTELLISYSFHPVDCVSVNDMIITSFCSSQKLSSQPLLLYSSPPSNPSDGTVHQLLPSACAAVPLTPCGCFLLMSYGSQGQRRTKRPKAPTLSQNETSVGQAFTLRAPEGPLKD